MPHFYLITGVMASGKSTVAEILASGLERAVHLRGDVFRRMIVSGRAEISDPPSDEAIRQLHLRYRLAAEAAKIYFHYGLNVVLQDHYYGAELTRILSFLEGYPVRVVVLCPNITVVQKREKLRGKVGYTGISVERIYETFLRETPRIGFWLDTSEQTPEQSAQAILKHFSGEN